MKTLHGIIKSFGGARKVSESLGGSPKVSAIMKWYAKGIPEAAWHVFVKSGSATIAELHFLNNQARAGKYTEEHIKAVLSEDEQNPFSKKPFSFSYSFPQQNGF